MSTVQPARAAEGARTKLPYGRKFASTGEYHLPYRRSATSRRGCLCEVEYDGQCPNDCHQSDDKCGVASGRARPPRSWPPPREHPCTQASPTTRIYRRRTIHMLEQVRTALHAMHRGARGGHEEGTFLALLDFEETSSLSPARRPSWRDSAPAEQAQRPPLGAACARARRGGGGWRLALFACGSLTCPLTQCSPHKVRNHKTLPPRMTATRRRRWDADATCVWLRRGWW